MILRSLGVGLLSVTSIPVRRVAFPLFFLGGGLMTVQPCVGGTGGFTNTANLTTARYEHTATLLPNGKVLVAGGENPAVGDLASAELYDPASGTWTATGSLGVRRYDHTATLLLNGKVLVVGGQIGAKSGSAELYDPASGTWTATGSLGTGRGLHTATLLPDGKVLVTGGINGTVGDLASAELYDPASGTWTTTGSLEAVRIFHTATLLPNGEVLAVGGVGGDSSGAEVYDPASGTWTATGSLGTGRASHAATLLPNGKVLVAGGSNGAQLASAELYDPASGTWAVTGSLLSGRAVSTATLLPNGKVLVAGGANGGYIASAELYDSGSETWKGTGNLATARYQHTATLLPNGQVLVAGGYGKDGALASAELYDSATTSTPTPTPIPTSTPGGPGIFVNTGSLINGRASHSETLLPSGKVLVAGGFGVSPPFLATAELYDAASMTWAATGSLGIRRTYHTATLLPNGKALVAGGLNSTLMTRIKGKGESLQKINERLDQYVQLASGELYDPASATWAPTGSLGTARFQHTATLLPNGKVLVAAGSTVSMTIAKAELYDPANGTWTVTGSLASARHSHTALLLPNGKVLVTGGHTIGVGEIASSELYDPESATWAPTGSLGTARSYHTATLLPNGKVLVAGGYTPSNVETASAELYDPASATWAPTGNLGTARSYHTATLLPNGKVLVAGGSNSPGVKAIYLESAELYDPANETWTPTGVLQTARASHTATLLPNGEVLVAGGYGNSGLVAMAERYHSTIPTRLGNISTRLRVETGDSVLIAGFIVSGTQTKRIIVRAIGPSLPLPGTLADPILELFDSSGGLIASNDNWRSDQEMEIIATGIPPSNDLESAIVAKLPANNSAYTAIVSGVGSGTGIGVVEAYDLDQAVESRLANISTRGLVGTDNDVLIAGSIILGEVSQRVLVRAIGPSLSIDGKLANPTLELRDGNGALRRANDNWRSDQEAEIIATGIPPTNDLESALIETLPANSAAYTAIVSGVGGTSGVALVEVYGLN